MVLFGLKFTSKTSSSADARNLTIFSGSASISYKFKIMYYGFDLFNIGFIISMFNVGSPTPIR